MILMSATNHDIPHSIRHSMRNWNILCQTTMLGVRGFDLEKTGIITASVQRQQGSLLSNLGKGHLYHVKTWG